MPFLKGGVQVSVANPSPDQRLWHRGNLIAVLHESRQALSNDYTMNHRSYIYIYYLAHHQSAWGGGASLPHLPPTFLGDLWTILCFWGWIFEWWMGVSPFFTPRSPSNIPNWPPRPSTSYGHLAEFFFFPWVSKRSLRRSPWLCWDRWYIIISFCSPFHLTFTKLCFIP